MIKFYKKILKNHLLLFNNNNYKYFCSSQDNIRTINTIKNIFESNEYELSSSNSKQLYKVNGWIRGKIQRKKTKWFLQLDDGSCNERLQIIILESLLLENNNRQRLKNGCSLQCIGYLAKSLGEQQKFDFICKNLEIIGDCPVDEYKIGHLKTGMEFDLLREQIHLRSRIKYFQSILRIRNELCRAINKFMYENHYIQIHTPLITSNDCEGGGECFQIESMKNYLNQQQQQEQQQLKIDKDLDKQYYFGRKTYLTVSGQLHLEAMALSLSRVYCFNTVFRAEKSMSTKHLSEFLMIELEQAFLKDLMELIKIVENFIHYLINELENNCFMDLTYLLNKNNYQQNYEIIKNTKNFNILTYNDARKLLSKLLNIDINNINNINAEMERLLLKLFNNQPIFLIKFPFDLKPFYMKKTIDNDNQQYAECFDLLTPICGEVCGGSLREYRYNNLYEQICTKYQNNNDDQEDNIKKLQWYLELRKFGTVPTGGFGFGFDRFIQSICGIQNIKDVVPFPRWPYHCYL